MLQIVHSCHSKLLKQLCETEKEALHFTFEFLTSSIVGGTSVKFLPTQATVSLLLSQLHTLGHFPASTGRLSANIS